MGSYKPVPEHLKQHNYQNNIRWDEADEQKLLELVPLKYTASQISSMIPGKTRNAVIGKLRRLGLSTESARESVKKVVPKPRKARALKKLLPPKEPVITDRPTVKGLHQKPFYPRRPVMPVPENPRRLTELPPRSCKFPVHRGVDGEWLMCADRQHLESPFCKDHHNICYQPRQYKVRKR